MIHEPQVYILCWTLDILAYIYLYPAFCIVLEYKPHMYVQKHSHLWSTRPLFRWNLAGLYIATKVEDNSFKFIPRYDLSFNCNTYKTCFRVLTQKVSSLREQASTVER